MLAEQVVLSWNKSLPLIQIQEQTAAFFSDFRDVAIKLLYLAMFSLRQKMERQVKGTIEAFTPFMIEKYL